jgi:hypothetical protein
MGGSTTITNEKREGQRNISDMGRFPPTSYLCLLLVCFSQGLHADDDWSIRGYVKSFALAQDKFDLNGAPAEFDQGDPLYQSQNSIRVMFEYFLGNEVAFELHYEASPIYYSSPVAQSPLASTTFTVVGNNYRLTDPSPTLGHVRDKSVVYQNLDRLNLQINLRSGDLTIGRQAISFGSARIINPTDVFLPFDVKTLNQEYRIGVDAIRFQKPLSDLSELDVGVILGQDGDEENSAVFAQALTNLSGMDISGTLIRYSRQNLIGAGIQSSLGVFGFWLEGARVWGDADYARLSTGLDYAFNDSVFGAIEYHFSEAGASSPEEYISLVNSIAFQKGGVFLLGRNYLIPAVSWVASPLLTVSMQALINLDDSSAFLSMTGEYSVSENLYTDVGVYLFFGEELDFSLTYPGFAIGSEYGGSRNLAYMSLKYYF